MTATIACLGGYDMHDDQVRFLCYLCLCGNSAGEVLQGVGMRASTKLVQSTIERLPFVMIKRINQAVGFRLLTKFGSTSVVNLGKAIPIAGGVVGGGCDLVTTKGIGHAAKRMFINTD